MDYFKRIENLQDKTLFKGFEGKLLHTENMTLSFWEIEEGSVLPLHHHHHEQVTHVLEGKLELTINGQTKICTSGEIALIPSNTPHRGKALTQCRVLDVFTPCREDYKNSDQ